VQLSLLPPRTSYAYELSSTALFASLPTPTPLQAIFQPLAPFPCLILTSGADESVAPELQPGLYDMGQRVAAAIGAQAVQKLLPGAGHACLGHEGEVAAGVAGFLQGLTG
jgi:hypothetical protein